MFYVEKIGNYSHGIFGIYDNDTAAIKRADSLASCDKDGYHGWAVRKSLEIDYDKIDYDLDGQDPVIYETEKKCEDGRRHRGWKWLSDLAK